jgi:hypothetical protein
MGSSDSFLVVERMIRLGEIVLSELGRLLDTLEEQQLITPTEHEDLLELARKVSAGKMLQ